MEKNRGFTLIEVMIVVMVVAILAAVLSPMLEGRVGQAKWSEAQSACGTIATALRSYWAEHGGHESPLVLSACTAPADFARIGLTAADLDGKYFEAACYATSDLTTLNPGLSTATPQFTITVTAADSTKSGHPEGTVTLDNSGTWTGP